MRINPNHLDTHCNLGAYYYSESKPDEAISELKEALRIDPNCIVAQYNLGNAYHSQGKTEESIACYHAFVKLATPEFAALSKQAQKTIKQLKNKSS